MNSVMKLKYVFLLSFMIIVSFQCASLGLLKTVSYFMTLVRKRIQQFRKSNSSFHRDNRQRSSPNSTTNSTAGRFAPSPKRFPQPSLDELTKVRGLFLFK